MHSHQIQINKTAHYYTIGEVGPHIQRLIIGFHGYGQAARRFIHKFEGLEDGETLILCPEGPSRFYWKNFTGEVVASWMTKQDRKADILDNSAYLNQLFQLIRPRIHPEATVSVLAFSQGCPTASRWLASERPLVDAFIVWAGQLAHDVDFASAKEYFQSQKLLFVYGTEDEFLAYGYKERQMAIAKAAGLAFRTLPFEGRHVIDRHVLLRVFKDLDREG